MAQENQPNQQKQQAQVRQQSQASPDSPFYTKDNMPDDCPPMARWLFAKGCQCLGDPNSEAAEWKLPGAPDEETEIREPKFGYVRKVTGRDKNGPIVETQHIQLMEQDGSNEQNMGQPVRPVTQVVITAPSPLVNARQAVTLMQAREAKVRRDAAAAKERQKAAVA